MPFIPVIPKHRFTSDSVLPRRVFSQFTAKWVVLSFSSLLDAQRTAYELPWIRAGVLMDWSKIEYGNERDSDKCCSKCGQVRPMKELIEENDSFKCPECKEWGKLDFASKAGAVKCVVAMLRTMADNDDVFVAENVLSKRLGLFYPNECRSRKFGFLWIQETVEQKEAIAFRRSDVKSNLICLPNEYANAVSAFPPDDMDTTVEEEYVVKILRETNEPLTRKQVIESLKQNFDRMKVVLLRNKVFINGRANDRFFLSKGFTCQMVGLTQVQAAQALSRIAKELPGNMQAIATNIRSNVSSGSRLYLNGTR